MTVAWAKVGEAEEKKHTGKLNASVRKVYFIWNASQ